MAGHWSYLTSRSRCAVMILALCAGCRAGTPDTPQSLDAQRGEAPALRDSAFADDGQWLRPGKDYQGTRFSGLTEITAANVASLQVKATFDTQNPRGHEAAPIIAGSLMLIVTPFPNVVYALDLTKPGFPLKWTYRPRPATAAQGVACCDVVNRGGVYDAGRFFFATLDNQVIALDAASGRELWRTKVGDINIGETMTMAPLVVKNRVLVGNSGGEMGVRGWITALDAASGTVAWTAFSTGPDTDVLIGPGFKAHYPRDQGTDLGKTTWPGDSWQIGGGNVWGWITYDPDLDLIYHGTGNPGPWNPEVRPGANKWTATQFARRPETGEAVWAYQLTPHDMHDYDGVNEAIVVDLDWQGARRKVLLRPERNGYVYVFDRATGEVLSAEPFGFINSSFGVDLRTGELKVNPAKEPSVNKVVRDICPAAPGQKDWQPSAYSPRTGLLYIPHQNLCMDEEGLEVNYIAGTPYVGMNVKMFAGPGGHRGEFDAWNPLTGRKVWSIKEDLPVWSGALVTAGDIAFYGTMDGWFKAVDARTGKPLWQHKVNSGIIGQPVTFRAPDGKQYVAILAGVGGWAGAIMMGIDGRDSAAALGFTNAMLDLPQKTTLGGRLWVFGL